MKKKPSIEIVLVIWMENVKWRQGHMEDLIVTARMDAEANDLWINEIRCYGKDAGIKEHSNNYTWLLQIGY